MCDACAHALSHALHFLVENCCQGAPLSDETPVLHIARLTWNDSITLRRLAALKADSICDAFAHVLSHALRFLMENCCRSAPLLHETCVLHVLHAKLNDCITLRRPASLNTDHIWDTFAHALRPALHFLIENCCRGGPLSHETLVLHIARITCRSSIPLQRAAVYKLSRMRDAFANALRHALCFLMANCRPGAPLSHKTLVLHILNITCNNRIALRLLAYLKTNQMRNTS
jgi:hypothetical protein